ncbi:MAG: DUF3617 family protein [Rhodospirillales bacterium]|nr:DUF3617 family protein [Rhodospirillales bacterium]
MTHRDMAATWLFAVLLAPVLIAAAGDGASAAVLPDRRPGFWQTTMTSTVHMTLNGHATDRTGRPMVTALCTDAATEAMERKKLAAGGCMHSDFVPHGNAYTIDGICKGPRGTTMANHGTMVVESDTRTDIAMDMTGPGLVVHMTGQSA